MTRLAMCKDLPGIFLICCIAVLLSLDPQRRRSGSAAQGIKKALPIEVSRQGF